MIEHTIQDGVVEVLFNRPEKMNCFNETHMRRLQELMKWVNTRDDIRIVIMRGAGKVFCAGFDIADFVPSIERGEPFFEAFPDTLQAIRDVRCATLAVLHASAYGFGCGIAMTCDFRVCLRGGTLSIPTARLGFTFPPNEVLSLTHKMGLPIIKDLLLAGRPLTFERAYALGIVHQLVENPEQLEFEVQRYVHDIRHLAPQAVIQGKRAIHHLVRQRVGKDHEAYQLYLQLFEGEDFLEGQRAFQERRAAVFTGA